MRVILTTWGTLGDVEPMAAMGRALQTRGAEVVIYTNPYFVERLTQKGLTVRGFGEPWSPDIFSEGMYLTHPHLGPIRVWKELFAPRFLPLYRAMEQELRSHRAELVLNHMWCFGGHFAAQAAGVATGFVSLAPISWLSSENPGYLGAQRAPYWFRRWSLKGPIRWLVRGILGRSLRSSFRDVGLSLSSDAYFSSASSCVCNIGLWSSAWRADAADDPANAWVYGFPRGVEPMASLSPEIETFLAEGEAPVVMGLGSALPMLAPSLYRDVWAACRALGQRAILVGGPPDLADAKERSLLVVPFAPYRSLFPRAKVLIHHGGINTLGESLGTGLPSVIIPFVNDQFDNAYRTEDLGAAVVLPQPKADAKRIKQALSRALEDRTLQAKAKAVGEAIRAEPCGIERVADAIMAGRWRESFIAGR